MTWSQEISQLVTEVDQLTNAVNVKKSTLDTSIITASNARDAAANDAILAANSASLAASFATVAEGHKNTAISIYGSQTAQQTALANAQNAALVAQNAATSASSILQQDLSGVTAQALHRSPNAITAMFLYDTSKDSDGGAWTERCQHTSWWNEAINGKWLGAQASEFEARNSGATLGAELVTNGDFAAGAAGWTDISGPWAVTNGALVGTNATAGSYGPYANSTAVVAGRTYRVTFTINVTGGSLRVRAGNTESAAYTVSGTYSLFVVATTTGVTVAQLRVGSAFTGTVDNISVREVIAVTTQTGDYFQRSTDGRFYRLWKNLLQRTEDFANTYWAKTNVTLNSGVSDPNNGTAAFTFTASANNATVSRGLGLLSGVVISCWIRRRTGSGEVALWNGRAYVSVAVTTSWTRVQVVQSASTAGFWDMRLAVAGDAVDVAFPQVEYGTAATAYEAKGAEGSVSEVFRGNKRDFPRLAGIVAEAGNVTIYDLTEPGRPMFARFIATATATISAKNLLSGANSVTALNGRMLVGGSGTNLTGLTVVDFIRDSAELRLTSGYTWNGNIASRNSTGGYMAVDAGVIGIASATVNAVAMTVLPDAPVDPVTGLRVPTIAVATGGGVSVIKHNGTVVNSASTGAYTSIQLTPYALHTNSPSGGRVWNIAAPLATLGADFDLSGSLTDGAFTPIDNATIQALVPSRSRLFRRESNQPRVRAMLMNETDTLKGLAFGISNTFNTGWMAGDIRRCFLSDTEVGSVTGPELVTNGGFATDTSWTKGTGVTIAGGVAQFPAGTESSIQQAIPLVAGKTYRVSFTVSGATASGARVRFGGQAASGLVAFSGNGTFTTLITAPSGATTIDILSVASTFNGAVDNVSVREAVLDRSYRAASAVVEGTLTRAQLASGTSLVGYSGFSAANYLREPYSADLDFGTGEWTGSAWVNLPAAMADSSFPAVGSDLNGLNWSAPVGGISYSAGAFTFDGTSSTNNATYSTLTPTASVIAGRTYRVSYRITNKTDGNGVRIVLGGVLGQARSANGTYVEYIVASNGTAPTLGGANNIAVRTGTVDNISIIEVGAASLFDRAAASGPRLRLGVTGTGLLTAEAFDGTTTRTVTTSAAYNTAQWLKARVSYTTDGTLAILVNGREVAATRGAPLLTLNSRYNLLTRTEEIGTSPWGLSRTTVTANAATAPNGTLTADALVETATTGKHYAFIAGGVSTSSGQSFTFSAYVKQFGSARRFTLLAGSVVFGDPQTTTNNGASFDLSSQTVISQGANVTSASISAVGDGWYRVVCTMTTLANGAFDSFFCLEPAAATTRYTSYTGDGTSGILIWGAQLETGSTATAYQRVTTVAETEVAPLTIGNSFALDAPFPGSIAMLKLGATVPTAEQATFMYEQEKQLFRAGALSVLPDSGAIVDMSYDDATDRWVAVSATNESYWTGLVRNSVTPVPAGSYTRVTTTSGVELISRSTTNPGVDITIPPYGLREELVKRAEAAARLSRLIATYDYVGGFTGNITAGSTAITSVTNLTYPTSYIGSRISGTGIPVNAFITGVSGTTIYISAPASATTTGVSISFLDFILPVGQEAKVVMSAGTIRREGSTADYTRLYDGFKETIRFATAPGATTWVQIQSTRIPQ